MTFYISQGSAATLFRCGRHSIVYYSNVVAMDVIFVSNICDLK